jgi:hypothetical protein
MESRQKIDQIKSAIRNKFAWPGGYALFGICSDGEMLCSNCMRENFRQILWSVKNNSRDGWRVDCITSSGEVELDGDRCAHCGRELEKI